ncbi:MAG TPA: hypothetical protein VG734_24855 [Lacunisphaera sp.]|nr:hypothetical protein [Lacunisphaera sp.]
MKTSLRALAFAIALVPFTRAHAISFIYDPGILHETSAFASFNTTGAEMAGMGVHVEYVDGSTHDATLQLLSAGNGRVNDSSLFLQIGNTGTTAFAWLIGNSASVAMRSISFDGQPGNTVFDVSFPFGEFAGFSFVGTPGTSTGRELELSSLYGIYDGLTVTYSDAVALTGAAAVGDVFRRMTIDFSTGRMLASGGAIEFRQDTDSLAFGSVLAPASVSEHGATLVLLCGGLMALVMCRRLTVSQ